MINAKNLLSEIYQARIEATQLISEMLQNSIPIDKIAKQAGCSDAIITNISQGQKIFDGEIACRILINLKKIKISFTFTII